jgi:2-polyprenyl-3-methyl-5-hydroxy-6-metoxy-1,4-benzoquinol methylase
MMHSDQEGSLVRSCNVCEDINCRLLVCKDGYRVYRCANCGLAFTHPMPDRLFEQYDAKYFELYRRRRSFRLKRADSRLRQIELLIKPGRLLDIGCSLGYFVEAAWARGWDACGIDVSDYAVDEARRLGLNVFAGTLEQMKFQSGSFDCITMWDVLEHVVDPTKHMTEVRRILAPGGLVVIGTPNIDHPVFWFMRERWRHLKPREHIYYFGRSSMETLLRKTHFRVVRPPVLARAWFPGHIRARFRAALTRIFRPNDVMTVYARVQE